MAYFLIMLSIIIVLSTLFLILLGRKINILEKYIEDLFEIRIDIIPSLFEVSTFSLIKHKEIFNEIIKLRKISFSERNLNKELNQILTTQQLIHNELNFIFKICNKHPKLLIDGRFIYLRELIISNSSDIGKYLDLYKNIIKKYNFFINIKNYTFIGLLIPINKKEVY